MDVNPVMKEIPSIYVASIKYKGSYKDCGNYYSKIFKLVKGNFTGRPMLLCYDRKYKENDANIEVCVPVRNHKRLLETDEIKIKKLPKINAASYVHVGRYDNLKDSYAKVLSYLEEHGYKYSVPTREVYLKGPGMLLKGNPDKYKTELLIQIRDI